MAPSCADDMAILSDIRDVLQSLKDVAVDYLIYLSFHTVSPPREGYVQVDCDLESKCKNRKEKS